MTAVTLLRAWPRDPATGAEIAVHLAGGGSESPFPHPYRAGLAGRPEFSAALAFGVDGWTGGTTPVAAPVVFSFSDPALADQLAALSWRDARSEIDLDSAGTRIRLLTGKVADATIGIDGALTLAIADQGSVYDRRILADNFAGSGGIEGYAGAAGRPKRRSFGRVFNVEGRLLDPANNIYEFGDPARGLGAFVEVRDKGRAGPVVAVEWQGSVVATLTALAGANPPAGGASVAPSIACVKWWTQPAGPLTADVLGEPGTGYVEDAPAIASRIIELAGGSAITNLAAASLWRPAPCGIHIEETSETYASALDRLLLGSSLLWVVGPTGAVELRQWSFDEPVAELSAVYLGRESSLPPTGSRRLGFRRNHRIHGEGEISAAIFDDELPAISVVWDSDVIDRPEELVDGRILTALRPDGGLQSTLWGGAGSVLVADLLEFSLVGKSIAGDPDFSRGAMPFTIYNNSGNGAVSAAVLTDPSAPNGSGRIVRVSYAGGGGVYPGFGGILQALYDAGSGVSRPSFYARGTKVAYVIRARIPVGRSLAEASNPTGDGGGFEWLTARAGTGGWATYIGIRTIGSSGNFAGTGYLYIEGGPDAAFDWDIALYDQRELGSAELPQVARLITQGGAITSDADLLTILGISSGILEQGPGATAPAAAVLNSHVPFNNNLIANSQQSALSFIPGWNPNGANISHGPALAKQIGFGWTTATYVLPGETNNVAALQTGALTTGTTHLPGEAATPDNLWAMDFYPSNDAGGLLQVTVSPGEWLIGSVFLASHICKSQMSLFFYSADGTFIDAQSCAALPPTNLLTNALKSPEYHRAFVKVQVPAGAVTALLVVRKGNTLSGNLTSAIWWAAPMLERVTADVAAPSPYVPGPASSTRHLGYTGDLDADVTGANVALGIADQSAWATYSALTPNTVELRTQRLSSIGSLGADWLVNPATGVYLSDRWPAEAGANITETRVALGIAEQGALATLNTASWGTHVSGRPTELTDGRIVAALRADGSVQSGLWAGANSVPMNVMLEAALAGKSIAKDPDFAQGNPLLVYNNSGGTGVTLSRIADTTAPNGSGQIIRVSYNMEVTSPGYGGASLYIQHAAASRPGFYAAGTKVVYVLRAKIPMGRALVWTSNPIGTGGYSQFLTDNKGTGGWATYMVEVVHGASGTFGPTGYWYITGGPEGLFTWDIALADCREIGATPLPSLDRIIDSTGVFRGDAALITAQGTALAIADQAPAATDSTIEPGADVTRNRQVVIVPPNDQTVYRDWQGSPKPGQYTNRVITPSVQRGTTDIRTSNDTSYSVSATGTLSVSINNTNGSADKGRITINSGLGTINLTVTVSGVTYGPFPIKVINQDDPPPVNQGSSGGSDSTLESVGDSFAQMTSADAGESIFLVTTTTTTQSLIGTAPLTYQYQHNSSGSRSLVARWEYRPQGGGTWTAFASNISGSASSWNAIDFSGDPGEININQSVVPGSAGTWEVRLVGAMNTGGGSIDILSGTATVSRGG